MHYSAAYTPHPRSLNRLLCARRRRHLPTLAVTAVQTAGGVGVVKNKGKKFKGKCHDATLTQHLRGVSKHVDTRDGAGLVWIVSMRWAVAC